MIRVDPDDDDAMSEQHRFYYLRLMAKPGRRDEPIRTKFVRWSEPDNEQPGSSRSDDPLLESQAMRVVRTIGQAFEVCHKVAQDQMLERHEDDAAKRSLISEDDVAGVLDVIGEEKMGIEEEASRSTSPMEPPPGPLYSKRMSLFQPRKASSDASSVGTAIDTTQQRQMSAAPQGESESAPQTAQINPTNPLLASLQHQQQQQQPQPQQQQQQQIGQPQPVSMYPGGSSTLPHSATMPAQWPQVGQFPSVPQLDQHSQMAFYPMQMPMVGASASMPYGLSSPVMVSPYATLQIPNIQQVDPNNPEAAATLSRSLDQYNQQLIRSQLDQAQQTAQVAGCQVQLLRDQLTSETTARIEAQSRTHQLLNANRELLEQVQNLVQRLQCLETKISSEIQLSAAGVPSTSTAQPPRAQPQPTFVSPPQEGFDPRTAPPVQPMQPYQMQAVVDIRSGSLPPKSGSKGGKMRTCEEGIRTEPESNNDDTTDYSSSDQYEKTGPSVQQPYLNVLMSNPMVMQGYPQQQYVLTQTGTQAALRTQERIMDDGQQPGPSTTPPKKKLTSVFKDKEFARMSFNPRLNKDGKDISNTSGVEDSLEDEEERYQPEKKESLPEKRRRDRITVESLFKPTGSPERDALRRADTAMSVGQTLPSSSATPMPASSSIVTAMYPPIRKPIVQNISKPKFEVVKKKALRALSMDIPEDDDDIMMNNRPSGRRKQAEVGLGPTREDFFNKNSLGRLEATTFRQPEQIVPRRQEKMANGQPPHNS